MLPSRLLACLALACAATAPAAQTSPATRMLHEHVPPDDTDHSDLAAGDLDGDGDVDLVTVATLRALLNDGLAAFTHGAGALPAGDFESHVVLADLDGDAQLDALVSGAPPALFLGDGAGGFAPGAALPAGTVRQEVAVGDLDQDGHVDVFLAGYQDRRVLLGDGAGSFALAGTPLATPAYAYRALLADVDGDGDLDAYVGNSSTFGGPNSLYANDGAGGLTDVSGQLVNAGESTHGAAFVDLDGDGDLDLCEKYEFGPFRAYLNDGAGTFSPAGSQPADEGQDGGDVAVGDVDGDGFPDALITAEPWVLPEDGQTHLYLGDGAGGWSDATAALPYLPYEETYAAELVDLDGDGDLDIATAARWHQLRVLLGDGQGAFRDVVGDLPPTADTFGGLVARDFDGDGFPDILAATAADHAPRFFRALGDGTFVDDPTSLPASVGGTVRALPADLDGDQDLDCVLVVSGVTKALINDGAGHFTSHGIDFGGARDGALADLDADGALDLVVVEYGAFSRTTLGHGDGTFSAVQLPFSALQIDSVDVADLNGDGIPDLWAGLVNAPDRIWIGDGTGQMIYWKEPVPAVNLTTLGVAFLDADNDGDLDTATSAAGGGRLYTQSGANWVASSLDVRGDIVAVDFDADGDVDIVGAAQAHELLLNDGHGNFASNLLWGEAVQAVLPTLDVADLDRDGDLDVVWGGTQLRALWNTERHLAWRRLPDAGEPLTLDLFGDAGSPWFLAWAPFAASVPLAPFGTLRLDPATLHALGAGVLDGGGLATFEATLPAMPTLVGLTVYAQGLLGEPLAFTGLEAVPISGF